MIHEIVYVLVADFLAHSSLRLSRGDDVRPGKRVDDRI
jgi:hypothetical protein